MNQHESRNNEDKAACLCSLYTVFHKKGPLFVFFRIHSIDNQFTQNLYQL